MKQDHSYKNILRIAFPLFISYFGQNVVNVTDTAFMGRVGETELGAVGNAGLFYMLFILIAVGFSNGLQIIIGRKNGENDYKTIGRLIQQGLYFSLPLASIMFCVLYFFSNDILGLFVKSPQILETATAFLKVRSFGIFFAIVNLVFTALFVGIAKTKVLSIASLVMTLTNVLLDYCLIFGKFGLPELGVEGAALASTIAEIANTIVLGGYILLYIDLGKYELFRLVKINPERLKRILNLSYPMMLQNFLSFGSWFIFFSIIEHLGERELAISHIIRSIYMLIMMPVFSLTSATNTLVSNLIGQHESDKVIPVIWKSTLLGLASNLAIGIFIWAAPEMILSIFTNNTDLISESIGSLFVISFSMFLFTIAFLQFTGINGSGNTVHSLIIEAINISIYLIATYIAVEILAAPLEVVWSTEFVYFTFLALMSYFYMKSDVWKGKKI
ncbi:MAG: MATE family efflux transporter [Flavobacteriales bacterium]|nr:MATE family efflux transporter [Flavobacteriales bacterium]